MQSIVLRVGRGENDGNGKANDIIINDNSVSRAHLEVFIDMDGNVFITDLNSTNGTYVNGILLKGDTMLKKGDVLKLGNSQIVQWEDWKIFRNNEKSSSISSTVTQEQVFSNSLPVVKKKNKAIPFIIGGGVLLITILCLVLLIFRNNIFDPKNPYEDLVLNKSKVESMSYKELQEAIPFHPNVFGISDSERVVTIDKINVILIIKDNLLENVIQQQDGQAGDIENNTDTETDNSTINTNGKVDTRESQSSKEPDVDKDGVPDTKDKCPDEKGTRKNKGCPDTSKPGPPPAPQTNSGNSSNATSDGIFEIRIAYGGESIPALLRRIKQTTSLNCPSPLTAEEIVNFNKGNKSIKPDVYQKMKDDESYVVPGGTPIKYRCN